MESIIPFIIPAFGFVVGMSILVWVLACAYVEDRENDHKDDEE